MVENKNGTTVSPGERIQQLCDTHQLTRKELALHLGVAPSQISRILNGDTKSINSDLLIKLAREFHVSTDYILGLSDIKRDLSGQIRMNQEMDQCYDIILRYQSLTDTAVSSQTSGTGSDRQNSNPWCFHDGQ